MTDTTPGETTVADEAAERVLRWIREHPSRAYAARFPVEEVRALLDENAQLAKALRVEKLRSASAEKLLAETTVERDVWHGRALGLQGERDTAVRRALRAEERADGIEPEHGRLKADHAELERHIAELVAERDQLCRRLDAAEAADCGCEKRAFDALERLHLRLHGMLPGDGSELPQPEDPFWARQLDELLAFADETYWPVADAQQRQDGHQTAPSAVAQQFEGDGQGGGESEPQRGSRDVEANYRTETGD